MWMRGGTPRVQRHNLTSAPALQAKTGYRICAPAACMSTDKKTDGDEKALRPPRPPPSRPAGKGGASKLLLPSLSHAEKGHAHAGCVPPKLRPAGYCLLLGFGLFAIHRFAASFVKGLEPDALRATFEAAGDVGGVALYVASFVVGELLHLPGVLFVAAGVLVWGRTTGWLLGVVTAPLAVTAPFLVARRLGAAAGFASLAELPVPLFKRLLARLDTKPLTTVILLRCCFFLSPPVTYALALSSLSFRHYMAGTFLGLLAPMALFCLFADKLVAFLGYGVADELGDAASDAAAALVADAGGIDAALAALARLRDRASLAAQMAAANLVT